MSKEVLRNKYSIAAIILIILLIAFIGRDLIGDHAADVDINDLNRVVMQAYDYDAATQSENRFIKRYYGLNPNDYGDMILYGPSDNMDVHEVFLVKLSDKHKVSEVKDAMEERIATQKKSFEGYGTDQTELLNKSKIVVKGNYLLLVVGENASQAADAFKSYL